jgi:DNA-binding IclR family transcriptional regulator
MAMLRDADNSGVSTDGVFDACSTIGISTAQVTRCLASLVADGLISRTEHGYALAT